MQKSYIADCISKKNVKKTGYLSMYLIRNNHKGIISLDQFMLYLPEGMPEKPIQKECTYRENQLRR